MTTPARSTAAARPSSRSARMALGCTASPAPSRLHPGIPLDQLHLPPAAAHRDIQAQAGDPAADDQHPLRSHRRALHVEIRSGISP